MLDDSVHTSGRPAWSSWLQLAVIALAVACGQGVNAEQTNPVHPTARTSPLDAKYFGLHVHRLVQTQPWIQHGDRKTNWPSVPVGTIRLWDSYVAWINLEPEPNRWNFRVLDGYVDAAESAGADILLPLALTPRWAAARPNDASPYGPGAASEPRDLELWARYVRTVASRYKGRIAAYEIWNEANTKEFFTGTAETLRRLACVARDEIKAVDPTALVLSPSGTGFGRYVDWMENYFRGGGGECADVIAYHFYVPWAAPEAMLPLINAVRDAAARTGNGAKQIWNTETGWWLANGDGTPDHAMVRNRKWKKLDVNTTSGAYLSRALILGRAAGLERFYWYSWDNLYGMGMLEPSSGKPKPIVSALDRTMVWLLGSVSVKCTTESKVISCAISKDDGAELMVVWSADDKTRAWTPPAHLSIASIQPLVGEGVSLQDDGTMVVSESPAAMILRR